MNSYPVVIAAYTKTPHTVEMTADLSIFKSTTNRDVSPAHVNKLVHAMRKGILYDPIYVNQNMEILDGQHRLEAFKKLVAQGIPLVVMGEQVVGVPYLQIQLPGYNNSVISSYNTNTRRWTYKDHVEHHVTRGNQGVIEAKEYLDQVPWLTKGVALYLLGSNAVQYKNGEIQVTNQDYDTALATYAKLLDFKNNGVAHWGKMQFVKAFLKVSQFPEYNHALMVKKLPKQKFGIHGKLNSYVDELKAFVGI